MSANQYYQHQGGNQDNRGYGGYQNYGPPQGGPPQQGGYYPPQQQQQPVYVQQPQQNRGSDGTCCGICLGCCALLACEELCAVM